MKATSFEDVLIAITLFSLFMSMPLLLLIGMPYRPPRWYRLARACGRLWLRAMRETPL